jgi:hypothetical protein
VDIHLLLHLFHPAMRHGFLSVLLAVVLFMPCAAGADCLDYHSETLWEIQDNGKGVDVFYVYPTISSNPTGNMDVNDPDERDLVKGSIAAQASVFNDSANIYAPYYRQLSPVVADPDALVTDYDEFKLGARDVQDAFRHYINNQNNGRPFMLAGHSQGTMALIELVKNEFADAPELQGRLVAAYLIGYTVTRDDLAKAGLEAAQRADDFGVVITYNTQSRDATGSPMLLDGALCINPLTWTTQGLPADKSLNAGAVFINDATGTFEREEENYAGAQVNTETGALMTTEEHPELNLDKFPEGIYHRYDYAVWYRNLEANIRDRIAAYLDPSLAGKPFSAVYQMNDIRMPAFATPGGSTTDMTALNAYGLLVTDTKATGTVSTTRDIVLDYDKTYVAPLTATGVSSVRHDGITNPNLAIHNKGAVSVSLQNYHATGSATAFGIQAGSDVTNTGRMTVEAKGTTATGYGIYLAGDADVDVRVPMAISASGVFGSEAYQVYAASGTTAIKNFAMDFGADLSLGAYQNTLGADQAGGAAIAFDPDAKLYIYPTAQFKNGTYTIPTLVENGADHQNYFAGSELVSVDPDITAALTANPAAGAGMSGQGVTVTYAPKTAPTQDTLATQRVMMSNEAAIVGNALRSAMLAGPTETPDGSGFGNRTADQLTDSPLDRRILLASIDPRLPALPEAVQNAEKGQVFIMPYYSKIDQDQLNANIYGFTGGYNHWVSKDMILGFHGGYSYGDMDFSKNRTGTTQMASAGGQGIYQCSYGLMLSGQVSLFHGWNDYKDHNPVNGGDADYRTYGADISSDVSRLFVLDDNNRIVPRVGLSYLWAHGNSYTIKGNLADVHVGSTHDRDLFATAGLDWYGNWVWRNWAVMPTAGIGIKQALTSGRTTTVMGLGNAVARVEDQVDDTTVTTNLALELRKDEVHSFRAGYTGAYGNEDRAYNFFLQWRYHF